MTQTQLMPIDPLRRTKRTIILAKLTSASTVGKEAIAGKEEAEVVAVEAMALGEEVVAVEVAVAVAVAVAVGWLHRCWASQRMKLVH